MSKIIKIDGEKVFIGTDNGQIIEARKEDCGGFMPTVGDEVITYTSGDKVIVTRTNNQMYTECEEPHVVNKITYGILAILLGNIGVHKFYAGYTAQGILYLLFFWTLIPGIIGLVEGVIAITQKGDRIRI